MAKLVMLTGPAGAGKSTISTAWAKRGESPRARIDGDEVRMLIHAGRAYPEREWTKETERQWNLAVEVWLAMVEVYKSHDVDCIVDIYAPPTVDSPFEKRLAELGVKRVVLLPPLEVCLVRNIERGRAPVPGVHLDDEALHSNYEGFEWCVRNANPPNVLDNSDLSVDEVVESIDELVSGSGPQSHT